MARIVLGVGGGIAAYKSVALLRLLSEDGHDVTVVPTAAALQFVGEPTWAALSHHRVSADLWAAAEDVPHVRLGREAELVVVAPATADLLGRAAGGLADDLLTTTLLTARCPVLFAPAMHTEMWQHPAVVDNVAVLRRRGATVLDPASGRLTGIDTGPGRLPEPAEIAQLAELLLQRPDGLPRDLEGVRLLVSAGGTREPIDPVRYLGNHSSGRQGFALAAVAAARGAQVSLIAANTDLAEPSGAEIHHVGSALELRDAVHRLAVGADVVAMGAAVADFRPATVAEHKIKKDVADVPTLSLAGNPDILAELVTQRAGGSRPLLVGFAAETGDDRGDVLAHGRRKLATKGCDLLVVNAVGDGRAFGQADNAAVILSPTAADVEVPLAPKAVLAAAVCDAIRAALDVTGAALR